MSGGYGAPQGDGYERLARELEEIARRLSELEIPTGTSMNSLVAQVQEAIAAIGTTINAWLLANSYTKAQIDNLVANPGPIAPTTVSASGHVSGASARFDGGLASTDVHSHLLTYGGAYTATWCHADGTIGTVPSSARFKQDWRPHGLDLTALERASVDWFRYKEAVANLGDEAEYVLGGSAEQFVDAGLGHTVVRDAEGLPFSIEDRPLLYTLLAGYQQLASRVTELEAQVAQGT